jgi:DNA-directed RNA polymerase omega subunit
MPYVPLEKLLDKTGGSMYKLAILAFRRALEIAEGSPILVETDPLLKTSMVALEEISQGKDKKVKGQD